jgi:hypothetical protein
VHVNGTAEELANLRALVTSFGLDPGLTASLLGWLTHAQTLLGKDKEACTQLNWFLKQVIQQAAGNAPKLTVAQATALLAAANALEGSLGCSGPGSGSPEGEQDLVGMIGTIGGMNLAVPETTILTNQVRAIGKQLVDGESVCSSLADLSTRLADDAGKKNRLTVGQAAQLNAVVAQVVNRVGCGGGGGGL